MAKKMDLSASPTARMMKNVQEKSNQQANSRTTIDLDMNLIDENPDNRSVFTMDGIESLAESIRQDGFFGVIEVYRKPDGRYEISAGHRRYNAMKLLGATTIPAIVSLMPKNDVQRRRKLIASNLNGRDMTPMNIARAIQYQYETLLIQDNDLTGNTGSERTVTMNRIQELAVYFNMSGKSISRYLSLNKLIPELQDMVEKKVFPWTSICGATKESEKIQYQIYEDVLHLLNAIEPNDAGEKQINGAQLERVIDRYKERAKKVQPQKPADLDTDSKRVYLGMEENVTLEENSVFEKGSFEEGEDIESILERDDVGEFINNTSGERRVEETPSPKAVAPVVAEVQLVPIDNTFVHIVHQLRDTMDSGYTVKDRLIVMETIAEMRDLMEKLEKNL